MSEAAALLRELSEPWAPGEKIREILDRIHRPANLSRTRCFDVWYGKARRIDPEEIEGIREAVRLKKHRNVHAEIHDLKLRIARLEATLSIRDSDSRGRDVLSSRQQASGFSGADCQ